jgi:MoaA/NifB/PqqE/SkfB family radical SAM enzyme
MDKFEKNLFLQEEAYKNNLSRLGSFPTKLTLPVAGHCDLKCIMCGFAQHPDQYHLKLTEEAYQHLKVLFPYLQMIELVGAELYPERENTPCVTDQIVEWSRINKHLKLYGFSHGMNIGPKRTIDIVDKFEVLSLSFDSHRKDTFESIRVGANFDRFLANVTRIAEEKKNRGLAPADPPLLQFTAVIMQRNYQDLPDLLRLIAEMGGVFLSIRPLQKDVEDKLWESLKKEDLFSDSELCLKFLEIIKECQKIANELGISLHDQTQEKIAAVYSNTPVRPAPSRRKRAKFCDEPWYHLYIRSNGVATFDFCSRKILGNINEDPVENIWNSKAARGERSLFMDGFYGHCYRGCRKGFETGMFTKEKRGLRRILSLGKK